MEAQIQFYGISVTGVGFSVSGWVFPRQLPFH